MRRVIGAIPGDGAAAGAEAPGTGDIGRMGDLARTGTGDVGSGGAREVEERMVTMAGDGGVPALETAGEVLVATEGRLMIALPLLIGAAPVAFTAPRGGDAA